VYLEGSERGLIGDTISAFVGKTR